MKFKFSLPKFIAVFITISVVVVLLLRDQIMEHKFAKAKLNILKSVTTEDPDEAWKQIKTIIDTTLNVSKDSIKE